MPYFTGNYSPCWNPHEQQSSQALSKNLSLRVESSPQCGQEVGHSFHQLQDRGSPSTKSSSQSPHEVTAMGKAHSEDQCVSSESVQNQSYQKHVEEQVKANFLVSNAEFSVNPQIEMSQSAVPIPYAYADPYFSGLLNAYGPQAIIQPQMTGIAPARIPLPPDVAQDSPIYVNAKQYHGILRRRQMRAKLEAQNKLVKNRKIYIEMTGIAIDYMQPYLHESRHLHALNRVRGSGGRFLSTKKQQHSDPTPPSGSLSASAHSHQNRYMPDVEVRKSEANEHDPSATTSTAVIGHANGTGGFVCYGSQHRGPEFR